MTRRLTVITVALPLIIAVEIYRRGYAAPILYGIRQHCRSRPDRWYEPDIVA